MGQKFEQINDKIRKMLYNKYVLSFALKKLHCRSNDGKTVSTRKI